MLNVTKHGEARPTVALKLIEDATGVHLIAVDEKGEPTPRGFLVSFARHGDGKLILHHGVNAELGFQLDSNGVLQTEVR